MRRRANGRSLMNHAAFAFIIIYHIATLIARVIAIPRVKPESVSDYPNPRSLPLLFFPAAGLRDADGALSGIWFPSLGNPALNLETLAAHNGPLKLYRDLRCFETGLAFSK